MKLKHGAIFTIPLLYNLGWSYAKYIDTEVIHPLNDGRKNNISSLLQIYNFFSDEKQTDLSLLNEDSLLIDPIGVMRINNRNYREFDWEIIGYKPLTSTDYYMPNVKSYWPPIFRTSNEFKAHMNIFNTANGKGVITTKEKVMHLEFNYIRSMELIMFRITLEYLKLRNIDIKDKYGFRYQGEEYEYNGVFDSPIYSQLPIDIRGKYQYWNS